MLWLTRNPKKDCNPDRSSADDRSTRPLSEKHLLHPVTPHSLLVTLLLHCFVLVGKASFTPSHTALASRYLATSLLRCFRISFKKLFPCGIVPPKFSAMVCPISASVSRTPRSTPAPPPGEYAKIGTYSRE